MHIARNASLRPDFKGAPQPATLGQPLNLSAEFCKVRFGLRASQMKAHPELYTVEISSRDMVWKVDGVHPLPVLADKVIEKMVRNGDPAKPGFVVLPNIADFIPAANNAQLYAQFRRFQDELHTLLRPAFMKAFSKVRPWTSYVHNISFLRPDAVAKTTTNAYINGKTLKSLHKDAHALVAAHAYGPIRDVEGGNFLVFDDLDFAKHQGIAVTDLYEHHPGEQFYCTPHLKPQWVEAVTQSDFVFEIPTAPQKRSDGMDRPVMVFMSNQEVGHGATPVRTISDSAQREFYRSGCRIGIPGQRGGDPETDVPPAMPDLLPWHDPKLHKIVASPPYQDSLHLTR